VLSSSADDNGAKALVGEPYSATAETEIVQTLSDGTRINQKMGTQKLYHDSQGRSRVEEYAPASQENGEDGGLISITILDPVAGVDYVINRRDHTTRSSSLAESHTFPPRSGSPGGPALQPQIAQRVETTL
jgi:hypothetical protein